MVQIDVNNGSLHYQIQILISSFDHPTENPSKPKEMVHKKELGFGKTKDKRKGFSFYLYDPEKIAESMASASLLDQSD